MTDASRRLVVVRGVYAGVAGAVALAAILVLVRPGSAALDATRRSLERSGVTVVKVAPTSGGVFENPRSAAALAAEALAYGALAGAAFGLAAARLGGWVAVVGCGLAVVVLAIVGRFTFRDVLAQLAFWSVAAGVWWRRLRSTSPTRP